jgi:D-glycero-D-manno-heptose 1,7-bisphosphate phosphatase
MLLAAARLLNLNLTESWMVGDQSGDLLAARSAGLRGGMHVLTGNGSQHRGAVLEWKAERFEVRLGESIREAVGVLEIIASRR